MKVMQHCQFYALFLKCEFFILEKHPMKIPVSTKLTVANFIVRW